MTRGWGNVIKLEDKEDYTKFIQTMQKYIKYINKPNDDVCLEISEKRQNTDEEARIIIKNLCKVNNAIDLQKLRSFTLK